MSISDQILRPIVSYIGVACTALNLGDPTIKVDHEKDQITIDGVVQMQCSITPEEGGIDRVFWNVSELVCTDRDGDVAAVDPIRRFNAVEDERRLAFYVVNMLAARAISRVLQLYS